MANQNGWDSIGTTEENKGTTSQAPAQQEDKLDFLALPEGETEVRVLDEAPYFYQGFWATKGNGAESGNGNGCWVPYKGKGKDLLEKANYEFMDKVFKAADEKGLKKGSEERKKHTKAGYAKQPYGKLKSKYIIHVIDRADGQVKLLDAGPGVFEALKELHAHKYHGDLRTYDVTIVRKGTGWQDTKYSVMANPQKTPLTDEEIKLYNEKKIDRAELKGGENLTPEQCLFIAQGGLWSEVGSVGQVDNSVQQMVEENYQANLQPGSLGADDKEEVTVDTSKEGALSDEELANVKF